MRNLNNQMPGRDFNWFYWVNWVFYRKGAKIKFRNGSCHRKGLLNIFVVDWEQIGKHIIRGHRLSTTTDKIPFAASRIPSRGLPQKQVS